MFLVNEVNEEVATELNQGANEVGDSGSVLRRRC